MLHSQSFEEDFLSIGKYALKNQDYPIRDVLRLRFAGFDRDNGYVGIAEIRVPGWKFDGDAKVGSARVTKLSENQYEIRGTKGDILRLIRHHLCEEK